MLTLVMILGAVAIGVISPGPSFILVARMAMAPSVGHAGGRRNALAAALGMGVGGVVFAGLALFGLTAVLERVGGLYLGLKLAGGLYLLYLGWRIWRGASRALEVPGAAQGAQQGPCVTQGTPQGPGAAAAAPQGMGKSFLLGLATQLSNPKTAVVYASIFAALLPAHPPAWLAAALLPLLFMLEAGWYSLVALSLSAARPRGAYLRAKTVIDRCAGAVMGLLGARLLLDAGH